MADRMTGDLGVQYVLTQGDVDTILLEHGDPPRGMNKPQAGDCYPALIVRAWSDDLANLQVFLDGAVTYWATSRPRGAGEGQWS